MDITFYINLLILDPHMLQAGTRPESANFHQEEHDSSGSRTTDPHEELPHLPMPQNETHKLPLSSRTHPATRATTNRSKTNHQHLVVAIKRFSDTLEELKSLDPVRAL